MGASILLVEDSKVFRVAISEALGDYGHKIICTDTLKAARHELDHESFDFILLDLNLPDGNGAEIIHYTQGKPDTRIIVMTASEDNATRAHLFEKGVIDYFSKENRIEFITENIQELIQQIQTQNAQRNIMFIGTDEEMFKPVQTILQRRNHPSKVFNHTKEAFASYSNYQLAFMDVDTVEGSAMELVRSIREEKNSVEFPIIVFSRKSDPDHISKWLKSGTNDFMTEPLLIEQFLLKAQQMIDASVASTEIKAKEMKFRLLADNSTDIIAKVDLSGKIEYLSPSSSVTLGIAPEGLIGTNIQERIHPDEWHSYWQEVQVWDENLTSKLSTCRLRHEKGKYIWMESIIKPIITSSAEKVSELQISFRDITERRMLEEQVIERSRQAAMGEIITTLSHQWRQPIARLGMIANNLQLDAELNTLELGTVQQRAVEISEHVNELSRMIDTFRDAFSTNKSKKPLHIKEILKTVKLALDEEIKKHGIKVQYGGDEQAIVLANRAELIQVFHGMFKNAIEAFSEKNIPSPSIHIVSRLKDGQVSVLIRDNAGGIPQEVLKKIFEPYSTTKGNIGDGVGLYLSHVIIVERHQGTIRASNIQDGAIFEITLPASSQRSDS